jgi:hypothetical protein
MNAYQVLGVEPGADERTIKHAYAKLVKQYRPDTYPVEFAEVRAAYEDALNWLLAGQRRQEQQVVEEAGFKLSNPVSAEIAMQASKPMMNRVPLATLPLEVERTFTARMNKHLEELASTADEQEMLERFNAFSEKVRKMQNLDQQMDFEHAVLNWMLNAKKPLLEIFESANARFEWATKGNEIEQMYGGQAVLKLQAINSLSKRFANARQLRNPFLQVGAQRIPPAKLITEAAFVQQAKQQSDAWQSECADWGLMHLTQYVHFVEPSPLQVFWVDITVAASVFGYSMLFVNSKQFGYQLHHALIIGLCLVMLLMLVRGIYRLIQAGLKRSSNKELGSTLLNLGVSVYAITIFLLVSTHPVFSISMIFLGVGMYLIPYISQFFLKLEGAVVSGFSMLWGMCICLKDIILVIRDNRNTSNEIWQDNANPTAYRLLRLNELKIQLVTSIKNGTRNIRILTKATPPWVLVIVIWILFKLVVGQFARL